MVETVVSTLDSGSTYADIGVFNEEEVDTHHRLMSQLETFAIASSSFTHLGNLAIALNASATHFDDPWVIDSGAFDHMTGIESLFRLVKRKNS